MDNNPETEATELSCSFIQNLSMHPSFLARRTTKSPPMQFPLAPWPPPKPIPRSPRCPLPPCKSELARFGLRSLYLRSTIWTTINLRIFASNVPVSPVTFIFDPSLLEVFLSSAKNSSNYPFWVCWRLRWSSAYGLIPKKIASMSNFFEACKDCKIAMIFRHPGPTAPWAASRRPSAQNDRAPGSRSGAPDSSVHGRFSVWFQCFNRSPCQGDVGYDFACTCECRFAISRSFWFNALHKLHGRNDFNLCPASCHIFISVHAFLVGWY